MKKIILLLLGIVFGGCAHTNADFEHVASTLNTPKLIDRYQQAHFSYAQTWEGYGCGGVEISRTAKWCPPEYIFKTGKGNCAAHAVFAVYCLRKAGYEAYVTRIRVDTGGTRPGTYTRRGDKTWVVVDYHYVALYKDRDNWWIMDDGRIRPQGISGPFKSIENLPYEILNIEGLERQNLLKR